MNMLSQWFKRFKHAPAAEIPADVEVAGSQMAPIGSGAPDDRPVIRVRALGFWKAPKHDVESLLGFPHPRALIAPDWEPQRRESIVAYLRGGRTAEAYMGYSYCRFEDCTHEQRMTLGTRDLTDGEWVWPEGLWHYVADHGVRLPEDFVASAAARGFVVPDVAEDCLYANDPRDWLRWVAGNTEPPPPEADACTLAGAQAVCAELSTTQWHAEIMPEHGRWRIELSRGDKHMEDYTGPIAERNLRGYLFRTRVPEAGALLDPDQAGAIAKEYE
jgi:hypothetical protein